MTIPKHVDEAFKLFDESFGSDRNFLTPIKLELSRYHDYLMEILTNEERTLYKLNVLQLAENAVIERQDLSGIFVSIVDLHERVNLIRATEPTLQENLLIPKHKKTSDGRDVYVYTRIFNL